MPGGFINGGFNVGRTMFPVPFGSLFSGLLDEVEGAAVAYSLRRLSSADLDVVRVRRASDNDEQDFKAAQVLDGALLDFCGSGDGFAVTIYDQSGNARHGQQATVANQFKVVDAGSLITIGGVPTIERTTTSQFFNCLFDVQNFSNAALYLVHNTASAGGILLNSYNEAFNNNDYAGLWDDGNASTIIDFNTGTPTYYTDGAEFTGTTRDDLHTALATGTNKLVSVVDISTALSKFANGITMWRYRNNAASSTPLGKLGDYILFDNSANRTAIEANLAAAYGITLA